MQKPAKNSARLKLSANGKRALLLTKKNFIVLFPDSERAKVVFDNMALYFECRINKNLLLQTDFAHWVV